MVSLFVVVNINGRNMKCEIDCGASVSVMSKVVYDKFFRQYPVYKIENKFTMADDSKCVACGVMNVILNNKFKSQIVIVESSRESVPLVGRTWLKFLFPSWKSSFLSSSSETDVKVIELGLKK